MYADDAEETFFSANNRLTPDNFKWVYI